MEQMLGMPRRTEEDEKNKKNTEQEEENTGFKVTKENPEQDRQHSR